jgi:hypothetical protein
MPGRCCHDRCLPSWGYVLSRRLSTMPVARHGFRAAPAPREPPTTVSGNLRFGPVGPFPGRAGLSRHRLPPASRRAVRPQSSRPLQGIAAELAARLRGVPRGSSAHGASQGLFPFSTSGPERSRTSPGFASPGYVPPPGFRTLLTAFPAPAPPGLFHPGSAHGVATLQSFLPPEEPWRLSALDALLSFPSPARLAAFPDAVTRGTMVRARRSVRQSYESRDASASGLCSPRESVAIRQWFRPPAARCSPGLQPLQGLHLRAWPDG